MAASSHSSRLALLARMFPELSWTACTSTTVSALKKHTPLSSTTHNTQGRRRLARAFLTTCLTSSCAHAVGDVACQSLVEKKKFDDLDRSRVARMGTIGFTAHGPFFFVAFRWIDALFTAAPKTLGTAVKKVVMGHATLFPSYLALFFVYASVLEGRGMDDIQAKLSDAFWPACVTGTQYWPAVQLVNQRYVPPRHKTSFTATAAIFWNVYISHRNKLANEKVDENERGGVTTAVLTK
ncbi:hypothetical protein PPROV_000808300 [Pycnococcus provasolii]|uniref:Uncharacterized protein n=1 Tax=Pycnococcus provasolii TaxID=41880 RepID=A0A830HWP1_9CHLO|nr:hypothetical protein PPROV_000808300 [Pycnococcus provasolii]